jgi:hypothetical protein
MEHDAPEPTAQFISRGLRRVALDSSGRGLFLDFEAHLDPGKSPRIAMYAPDGQGIPAALRRAADMVEAALRSDPPAPLN